MRRILLSSFIALGACGPSDPPLEETGRISQATTCDIQMVEYPVRAPHNHGYDPTAGNSGEWSCDDGHSNSDFVAGDHLGNDIWAAEGTPVVATVSGTLTLVEYSSYSGNKLTIIDECGWYHFYCHLSGFGPGIVPGAAEGQWVKAGQTVGYVGKTGTASNGVVHLHYSVYPDGNYNAGVDPWPHLHEVEQNVCVPPNVAPFGALEDASCDPDGITGFAIDVDDPSLPVEVRLVFDGDTEHFVTADIERDALCDPLGSCAHGFAFTLPDALRDGAPHQIAVFTADLLAGEPVPLEGSPVEVTCPSSRSGSGGGATATAGVGGSGAGGSTSVTAPPSVASSDAGCSTSSRPAAPTAWWWLALGALVMGRGARRLTARR